MIDKFRKGELNSSSLSSNLMGVFADPVPTWCLYENSCARWVYSYCKAGTTKYPVQGTQVWAYKAKDGSGVWNYYCATDGNGVCSLGNNGGDNAYVVTGVAKPSSGILPTGWPYSAMTGPTSFWGGGPGWNPAPYTQWYSVEYGNCNPLPPPTGSISGPTTLYLGSTNPAYPASGTYTATGSRVGGGTLTSIGIYVSPVSTPNAWTTVGTAPCSGTSCTLPHSWTPTAPGQYYVVLNVYGSGNVNCTGNPWGVSPPWYNCGSSDAVLVNVINAPPPAIPTSLSVSSYCNTSSATVYNQLSWNPVVGATSFNVFRGTDNITFPNIATLPGGITVADDTGAWNGNTVVPGQAYYYKIQAVNQYGGGPLSNSAGVTTTTCPPSSPWFQVGGTLWVASPDAANPTIVSPIPLQCSQDTTGACTPQLFKGAGVLSLQKDNLDLGPTDPDTALGYSVSIENSPSNVLNTDYSYWRQKLDDDLTPYTLSVITTKKSGLFTTEGSPVNPLVVGGPNWQDIKNQQLLILHDGDVTVTDDILTPKDQNGVLLIVASGTITIDPEVTQLQALLMADHVYTGTLGPNANNQGQDQQLIVQGQLVGWSGVTLERNLGVGSPTHNGLYPAELIEYRPDMIQAIRTSPDLKPMRTFHYSWSEINP